MFRFLGKKTLSQRQAVKTIDKAFEKARVHSENPTIFIEGGTSNERKLIVSSLSSRAAIINCVKGEQTLSLSASIFVDADVISLERMIDLKHQSIGDKIFLGFEFTGLSVKKIKPDFYFQIRNGKLVDNSEQLPVLVKDDRTEVLYNNIRREFESQSRTARTKGIVPVITPHYQ